VAAIMASVWSRGLALVNFVPLPLITPIVVSTAGRLAPHAWFPTKPRRATTPRLSRRPPA
jgi:hypothetical protein